MLASVPGWELVIRVGLLMTIQLVGGVLGLSVLASLSARTTNGLLAAWVAERPALTNGYRLSFAIGAGLVLVRLVVAGAVLRPAEDANQAALRRATGPTVMPSCRLHGSDRRGRQSSWRREAQPNVQSTVTLSRVLPRTASS